MKTSTFLKFHNRPHSNIRIHKFSGYDIADKINFSIRIDFIMIS